MQDRVAIYCRLSKEDEGKGDRCADSESIQNQKLLLVEHAVKQGWQIHGMYADDDFSGLDKERPALNAMLAEARQGRFNIILCKNQSRFSRDMEMIERYLHNLFVQWGIRFVGVVDHVDTGMKGGKKARQISGLVNEWYCEDISENVTAALAAKKRNGQYLGHWCTYGYALHPADRHKLVVDDEAAGVVREMYRQYLSGQGVATIANGLTARGVLTPTAYKRAQGKNYRNPAERNAAHGAWAVSTVRRILRDETYLGHLIQGRERKLHYKSKKVVKVAPDEWIVVRDNHEAIIDEDAFAKVQSRLGVRSAAFGRKGEPPKAHLFAGKVRCLQCGGTMQKHHGRNGVQYLKCGLALRTGGRECTLHTLRMDALRQCVEERIQGISAAFVSEEQNEAVLRELLSAADDTAAEWRKKESALTVQRRRRAELSEGISAAYMDKACGGLTEVQFQAICRGAEAGLLQCEAAINRLEADVAELAGELEAGEQSEAIKDCLDDCALTQEMVNDFVDYIEIGERDAAGVQGVCIHWLF